jgi:hypothetical protein
MAKNTEILDLPIRLKNLLEIGKKSEQAYSQYILKATKKPLTNVQKSRMMVHTKRIGEIVLELNEFVKSQGYSISGLDLLLISGEYVKISSSGSYKTIYVLR